MKRRISPILSILLMVGLALMVGLTSGCQKKAPKEEASKEASKEPYVIGAIFSVTGRAAPLGEPEKQTAEMLVKQINDAGGVAGHKIELIVEDDEGDETKAVMAATKLIEQKKVLAVIGPSTSGPTLAIMKKFEESQTPLISCAASVKIVEPINKWVFKTPQSDRDAVSKILKYLEGLNIKKIAFISDSNAFGMSGLAEIENLAPKAGFEIVAKESFTGTDTEMTAQLTRIKGTAAQAVICWGTNPGPAVITKNMKQLKMTIPLIQSHGVANSKYIELAGDANGVVLPAGKLLVVDQLPDSDPQKAVLSKYATDFKTAYKKDADTFGGHAYDAITILTKALETAGADKAALRDAIEKITNYSGTAGIFNFSPTDHNGLTEDAFVMIKIEDGKWKMIQ